MRYISEFMQSIPCRNYTYNPKDSLETSRWKSCMVTAAFGLELDFIFLLLLYQILYIYYRHHGIPLIRACHKNNLSRKYTMDLLLVCLFSTAYNMIHY